MHIVIRLANLVKGAKQTKGVKLVPEIDSFAMTLKLDTLEITLSIWKCKMTHQLFVFERPRALGAKGKREEDNSKFSEGRENQSTLYLSITLYAPFAYVRTCAQDENKSSRAHARITQRKQQSHVRTIVAGNKI